MRANRLQEHDANGKMGATVILAVNLASCVATIAIHPIVTARIQGQFQGEL
jgi:hypothetical protein